MNCAISWHSAPLIAIQRHKAKTITMTSNPELLRATEEEVESRRAIERAEKSKDIDEKSKESEWKEVPVRKGKSVAVTSIRRRPLAEAYLNPLAAIDSSETSGAEHPGHASTSDGPAENLLEAMQRRLVEALARSSASPSFTLSGISSIRAAATNAHTHQRRKLSTIDWTVRPTHIQVSRARWRWLRFAFRAART